MSDEINPAKDVKSHKVHQPKKGVDGKLFRQVDVVLSDRWNTRGSGVGEKPKDAYDQAYSQAKKASKQKEDQKKK